MARPRVAGITVEMRETVATTLLAELPPGQRYSWVDVVERGLCHASDPDAFYVNKGGSIEPAKSLCAECPMIIPCREEAIDRREGFGIWGGLSTKEIIQVAKLRRAKNDQAADALVLASYQKTALLRMVAGVVELHTGLVQPVTQCENTAAEAAS